MNKPVPHICPINVLIDHVPPDASLLDIGCGTGLFINLLAYKQCVGTAYGIDAAAAAIETAKTAARTLDRPADITFECRSVEAGLPEGKFDVVSMIDVLHHVQPQHQRSALQLAASRVADGGLLLFKDIGPRPLWRAWANRMHDLLLAQQWISYVAEGDVEAWMREVGFRLRHRETINMLWYGHTLMLFEPDQRKGGEPSHV